jgi:PKD repeat protein
MNQAYFNFNQNGLEVQFNNLSVTDSPIESLEWDFGDGNISTDENPVHLYQSAGFFNVKLTLTLENTETAIITLPVGVLESDLPIPNNLPLILLVKQTLPIGLTISDSKLVQLIRTKQEYLYPLVVNPPDASFKFNELYWESLENVLISKLVTIDLIIEGANSFLLSQGKSNTGNSKVIKKITTGPADTEWFNDSDTWKNIMNEGGVLDNIKKDACDLAGRLRIFLPFCPVMNKRVVPKVFNPERKLDIAKSFFQSYKKPNV